MPSKNHKPTRPEPSTPAGSRPLLALNRQTGAIVYQRKLPTTTNAPIAIAGHTVLVPAGGPTGSGKSRDPQLIAYTPH